MIGLDELRGYRVIHVGGVSGSGKSHFADALGRLLNDRAVLHMDWILNGLDNLDGRPSGGRFGDHDYNVATMEMLGPELLRARIDAGDRVLVEGSWVSPQAWQEVVGPRPGTDCIALYFGYPTASVGQVVERLAGTGHWLGETEDRDRFVAAQIAYSRDLRDLVEKNAGTCFIDTSRGFPALPT